MKNSENKKQCNCVKELSIEYEMIINRRLYEQKKISLEIYEKMENYLIKKLNN